MNKTQKGALAVLIITLVLLLFSITLAIAWFSYEPILVIPPFFFFILTFLVMGLSVIFLRRKQSPSEVDYDERDKIIKQKAIFASYITLWVLVFIIASTTFVMTTEHGIPANPDAQKIVMFSPPIVFFLMYLIVKMVYSMTILIQYGWKKESNNE